MLPLLSINWDPNPELFNLFGHIPVRYYGLLWVIGIACSYFVVRYQYRDKKIGDDKFEPLFFYCFSASSSEHAWDIACSISRNTIFIISGK